MTELFDVVAARLKAVFAAQAALELEAELIECHVQRKAGLLRQAAELEREGLAELAAELRRHAGEVSLRTPGEGVTPTSPGTDNALLAPANSGKPERKKGR